MNHKTSSQNYDKNPAVNGVTHHSAIKLCIVKTLLSGFLDTNSYNAQHEVCYWFSFFFFCSHRKTNALHWALV